MDQMGTVYHLHRLHPSVGPVGGEGSNGYVYHLDAIIPLGVIVNPVELPRCRVCRLHRHHGMTSIGAFDASRAVQPGGSFFGLEPVATSESPLPPFRTTFED